MARFTVNATRFDPYLGYRFKILFGTVIEPVAAVSKCSALKKTTEVTSWYEGGDASGPRQIPGKTKYDPITLEAGVTQDRTFEEWANLVNNYTGEAATSLAAFRKDITIQVCNHQGNVVLQYKVFRCWVSEYQALPQLDASGNAVMITTLKLENEGWQRDALVPEPQET